MEKEEEKHQCLVASHMTPIGDLAHNPGMCPDWESNWRPFGSQSAISGLSYTAAEATLALLSQRRSCSDKGNEETEQLI